MDISKRLYDSIFHLAMELEFEIKEYRILYIDNQQLISQFDFFGRLRQMYWMNFIVKIYALHDRAFITKNKDIIENMTLKNLIENFAKKDLNNDSSADRVYQIDSELDSILETWKAFRNKLIAHYDKDAFYTSNEFNKISLDELELALSKVFEILDIISKELNFPFSIKVNTKSEIQRLLKVMEFGKMYLNEHWE